MRSKKINRKEFIQLSSSILVLPFISSSFLKPNYKPSLSFSTLGCPDWSFENIVSFAAKNSYDGIEVRGIMREMDLTKATPFLKENINTSTKMMTDNNLKFVDLGSSCTLHFSEGNERQKNIDEGKRFVDLAQQLSCPFIRVFPNNFPKDQDKQATKNLIAGGLLQLGDYAKGSNVTVLMETHGDVVYTADILDIAKASQHEHTGLVWDAYNMWSVTKEPPATAYAALKKYIRHTHIKDAKTINGKDQYVLMGTGTSPIFEAVDLLAKDNYKGYYSFEWEKLWHPEIDDPEIAIAQYSKVMREHFEKMKL